MKLESPLFPGQTEQSAVLIHELDSSGRALPFSSANPAAAALFGKTQTELCGLRLVDLLASDFKSVHERLLEELISSGQIETKLPLRLAGGGLSDVPVSATFFEDADSRRCLWIFRQSAPRHDREQEQAIFAEMVGALCSVRTAREAGLAILSAAEKLFGWDSATINVVDDGRQFVSPVLRMESVAGKKRELPGDGKTKATAEFLRVLRGGACLYNTAIPGSEEDTGLSLYGCSARTTSCGIHVPVRQQGDAFGILSIHSCTPYKYDQRDLQQLQVLADSCSAALRRTIAEESLRQQAKIASEFAELGRKLSSAFSPEDVTSVIVEAADRLIGWDAAFVDLCTESADLLTGIICIDTVDGRKQRIPPRSHALQPTAFLRKVLDEGPQLLVQDKAALTDAHFLHPFGDQTRRSASLLFVPFRIGGENVGILSIQSYKPDFYSREDLKNLCALADHCSGALKRSFAERHWRVSEQRLSLVTAQIPAIIWTVDCDLHINLIQGGGFRQMDFEAADFLGASLQEFLPDEKSRAIATEMNRRGLRGEVSTYEMEISGRLYECYLEPLLSAQGEVIGCINIGHDITNRKQAEQQLHRAYGDLEKRIEERTRELHEANTALEQEVAVRKKTEEELERSLSMLQVTLESATDGIVAVDARGRLINWNQNWAEMWRVEIDETHPPVGWLLCDRMMPYLVMPSVFEARFLELLDRPEEVFTDLLELLDGRVLECFSMPRTINDRVLGRVWSFRDVTLRKRAEEALAASEAVYREAIENAYGVPYRWCFDKEDFDFMGGGIEALLGIPAGKITRKHLIEMIEEAIILDPKAPQNSSDLQRAFLHREVDRYQVDLKITTARGETKWVNDCSVPVVDEASGKVIGSLGILQDITPRKVAEEAYRLQQERLTQTEKLVALGTLVSGVAHEINNPNNFIMLNTPLLTDAWASAKPILDQYYEENGEFLLGGLEYSEMGGQIRELLRGVYDGSRRIASIVQELRDFARPSDETMTDMVDMNKVVRSALVLLRSIISRSTDNFQVQYADGLPAVHGNFHRLEQVVINLIQNACQALPDTSRAVRVATFFEAGTGSVVLEVSDEGVGIKKEMLKHIYDPFFTTKRDDGGTGLGLSISTKIVHAHHGTIDFESEDQKGTTARITLPARPSRVFEGVNV